MSTRVLFFAEGATLAHVARPYVLAGLLPAGWTPILARPAAQAWLTAGAGFECIDLACQPAEVFAARLASGQPLYELDTLQRYVAADLALIEQTRPDLVVGDFRLSLAVSARLAQRPYATLCDAYWSPEAPPAPPPLPVLPFTRFVPIAAAEALFARFSRTIFRRHAQPMDALRRLHGLPDGGGDLRLAYTDADLRLFAAYPALYPAVREHAGAAFVGPVTWSPPGELPADFPSGERLVYVSMGSSGAMTVLPAVLDALLEAGCTPVLSTAGRALPAGIDPRRVHVFDFLPGDKTLARCCLLVCNGGSPSTLQALGAGAPILGIATNMDQMLNMRAIEAAGCGIALRADRCRPPALADALERLLNDTAPFRAAAQRVAASFPAAQIPARFAQLLERLLSRPPARP